MFLSFDSLFSLILIIVSSLIAVAYFTLLERNLLAGFQLRKGPNVASFKGGLTPIYDFLKLLQSELSPPYGCSIFAFILSPIIAFFFSTFYFFTLPWISSSMCAGLLFLLISSLHLYPILLSAWSSNSVYASLASARASVLLLSYDIPLVTYVFSFILLSGSIDLNNASNFPILSAAICLFSFFTVLLAESHRAPFDFVEAESELVSGYNVEYGGWGFALLIVSEYLTLLLMGQLIGVLLLSPCFYAYSFGLLISLCFLSFRGALPRPSWQGFLVSCWSFHLPLSFLFFVYCLLCF